MRKFSKLEHGATVRARADPDDTGALELLALAQSMQGRHEDALASIETARSKVPESRDKVNGPEISFFRSVILMRAGRTVEAYAEVARLLHVPFSSGTDLLDDRDPIELLLKDDPHYDELINRPPRL